MVEIGAKFGFSHHSAIEPRDISTSADNLLQSSEVEIPLGRMPWFDPINISRYEVHF